MPVTNYDWLVVGGSTSGTGGAEATLGSYIIGSSSLTEYKVKDLGRSGTSVRITNIRETSDGNLLVADWDGLYKYNKSLNLVTSYGSSGSADFDGDTVTPFDFDIDSDDNAFVYDQSGSNRIYQIGSDGSFVQKANSFRDSFLEGGYVHVDDSDNVFVGVGYSGYSGHIVAHLDSSLGVANYYIDEGAEVSFSSGPIGLMVFGGTVYCIGYDAGPGGGTGFTLWTEPFVSPPSTTATQISLFAGSNHLYSDGYRNRVIRHSSNGDFYIIAPTRSSDSHNIFRVQTDGTVAASAQYSSTASEYPHCIAEDLNGNIWVGGTDQSDNTVLIKYDQDLTELDSFDLNDTFGSTIAAVTALYFYNGPLTYSVYPDDLRHTKKLVAFGNDEVWYESTAGTMAEISEANGDLDMTRPLQAFEGFQKVFAANNSLLYVADFNNTRLAISSIDSTLDRDTVLTHSDGGQMVVDYVDGIAVSGYVYGRTITTDAMATGSIYNTSLSIAMNCTSVKEAPLWYVWTTYADSSSYGSLPAKATLGCIWRGRAVLAGNPNYPFQWYMSRVANVWDWAYVSNDALTPVAGGNADAGEIGDHVTALIPYNDDYLIFGCLNSVWVMRGDPAYGGQLDIVSLSTGIYGPKSWTWDSDGNLFFFGTGGLYKMPKGFGAIQNLSALTLPELVDDNTIDPSTHRIVLGYDPRRRGLTVAITTVESGDNQNYWFDMRTNGFYPETYSSSNAVYCTHYYESQDDDYRRLLLGCANGYISYFKDTAKNDNAADVVGNTYTAIESEMLLPILPLGDGEDTEGRVISMTYRLAGGKSGGTFTDTDAITYALYVADSAEEVLEDVEDGATALVTGTLSGPGRKKRIRTKAKGMNLGVVIKSANSDETWSIEKVTGVTKPTGRNKR